MIREERDAGWWQRLAEHPAIAPSVFLTGEVMDLGPALASPDVVPLATAYGGFLFYQQGDRAELHAMFLPEGRGRHVAEALPVATEAMIARGVAEFVTLEIQHRPLSRPPLSHGWRPNPAFGPGPLSLSVRLWRLPVDAWRASPAYRRFACRQSS